MALQTYDMGRIFNTDNSGAGNNQASGGVGGGRIYTGQTQSAPAQQPPPIKKSQPVIPQDQQTNQQKGFNLGQLFGQVMQAVKDPKKTLDTLVKGGKVGVKELEALFAKSGEAFGETNPLNQLFNKDIITKVQKADLSGKIYKSASEQKAKDTSKMNAVQKFIYGAGEFAPAAAIPIPGAEEIAVASPFLKGLVEAGVTNAGQAALLYNPKEHKDGNQLQDFLTQTGENFVFGAGFKLASKIVLKPMQYAYDAIINNLTTRATDKAYQDILPTLFTTAREGTAEISSKDLKDVLTGQKSANDFQFFQSPTWKDTVKKYGANTDNWPDTLVSDKPVPNPTQVALETKALPASELHTVLEDNMELAVNDLADGRASDFSTSMAVVKEVASNLESKGYKVNYNDLLTGINNVANYRRSVNDFNMGVLDQEANKSLIQHLEDNGLLKPLLEIKKQYNLTQNRPNYTDDMIVAGYNTWGKKSGAGSLDELGSRLNQAGYNVSTDPKDIIDFAKKLPTLESIRRKIELPQKEISVKQVVNDNIKSGSKQIETPYAVSQSELERMVKPTPEPIKIDVKAALEEKVKARENQPTLKEKVNAPKISMPETVTGPINKVASIINEARIRMTPSTFSEKAREAAGLLREYKAFITNDKTVEHLQNKKIEADFEKLSESDHLKLINNYETTGQFGKGMEAYSKYYKETTDQAHQVLQDVFGLEGYVDNYIKRAFKFNDKNSEFKFTSGFTKTLQQYSASPLKERKYVTMQDAMDYMTNNNIPFDVVETNPERLRQWTVTNANAAQAFSFLKQTLKDHELIRFVKFGDKLLPNEDFVNDRWANVMFKSDAGMVAAGRYAAPHEVAVLMNNSVSNGLFDISPTLTILRDVNNSLNQFQLGISAFHVATTTASSLGSEMGLAIQELAGGGQRLSALKRMLKVTTVIGPVVSDYLKGRSYIKALQGNENDALVALNEKINRAGGRLNIENRYRTQASDRLMNAIKSNKNVIDKGVTVGRSLPFAVVEQVSKPIMEVLVPRVKIGRFLTEADSSLARATKNNTVEITKEAERALLGNLWDKIDDVHGQLVQDNLFWNNMVKDAANLALRSFGWTYGTLKVAGTGAKEALFTIPRVKGGGEVITPSMGILIGYPIAIAMVGGIMHYFNTGQAPQEMMDYYFPKTGQKTQDGRDIRLSVPGYMKDMFSYARDPLGTLLNKMSPELSILNEIRKNKDYYGVVLRNPDDPLAKQATDMGTYLLSKYEPISISSFQKIQSEIAKSSSTSSNRDLLEGFLGFQRASNITTQTAAERRISELYANQLGQKTLTKQEFADVQAKSAAKKAALGGDYSKLEDLLNQGKYTSKGFKQVLTQLRKQSARGYDSFQEMFSKLSYDAQQRVYKMMSDSEKKKYQDILKPNPN